MNSKFSATAEMVKDIFSPQIVTMTSSKEKVVYKGSDILAQISTVEIPDRTLRRLSIQVYTDGASIFEAIMKADGKEIVVIDGLMYLVIPSAGLMDMNNGALKYTAVVGIGNDAFPDFIQDVVIENEFGYELRATTVTLPNEVPPVVG